MSNNQWAKAKELAARNYFTVINREESDKGEYYYVAAHPDLPGCMADGQTPEEAKQELAKALVDYIYFLLEDNVTVPEPKTYEVTSQIQRLEEGIVLRELPIGYIVEEFTPT
jgi:predicted RNase H-like HicB family nuclease